MIIITRLDYMIFYFFMGEDLGRVEVSKKQCGRCATSMFRHITLQTPTVLHKLAVTVAHLVPL